MSVGILLTMQCHLATTVTESNNRKHEIEHQLAGINLATPFALSAALSQPSFNHVHQ
jgi:hypothetical protein